MYKIDHMSFTHKDGTKDYSLTVVSSAGASKKFVLIKRWGKVSDRGARKIEEYQDMKEVHAAVTIESNKRMHRGYENDQMRTWRGLGDIDAVIDRLSMSCLKKLPHSHGDFASIKNIFGATEKATARFRPVTSSQDTIEADRGTLWGSW